MEEMARGPPLCRCFEAVPVEGVTRGSSRGTYEGIAWSEGLARLVR